CVFCVPFGIATGLRFHQAFQSLLDGGILFFRGGRPPPGRRARPSSGESSRWRCRSMLPCRMVCGSSPANAAICVVPPRPSKADRRPPTHRCCRSSRRANTSATCSDQSPLPTAVVAVMTEPSMGRSMALKTCRSIIYWVFSGNRNYTLPEQEKADTRLMQLKMDNGPESSGRRTQFLSRMVQLADAIHKPIQLLYYPPYHRPTVCLGVTYAVVCT